MKKPERSFFVHGSSYIDESCEIGKGTRIWHFCHVMRGARVGENCVLGQNVYVGANVRIGDHVKIQNNVSVYEGVTLEDNVFCGPSVVFTNVINPRAHISRKSEFKLTLVKKGATLGANATILCGHVLGQFCFIGAAAVVTKDVLDHAVVVGNPAKQVGWVCTCGVRLGEGLECSSCARTYRQLPSGLKPEKNVTSIVHG